MRQRKPTKRILTFSFAAMVASLLAALLELLPVGSQDHSRLIAAGGFGVAALLWWIVFVRWKRRIDAGTPVR